MENAVVVLAKYFNVGEGKRPLAEFAKEIKALTVDDKEQLVKGITDGTLTY
jgi:predicted Zn-dependent peptidase